MHDLKALLKQSDELPSLPEIYIKVSELLESENSTDNFGSGMAVTGRFPAIHNSRKPRHPDDAPELLFKS